MGKRVRLTIWLIIEFFGLVPVIAFAYVVLDSYFFGFTVFDRLYIGATGAREAIYLFIGFFWPYLLGGLCLSLIAMIRVAILVYGENKKGYS